MLSDAVGEVPSGFVLVSHKMQKGEGASWVISTLNLAARLPHKASGLLARHTGTEAHPDQN